MKRYSYYKDKTELKKFILGSFPILFALITSLILKVWLVAAFFILILSIGILYLIYSMVLKKIKFAEDYIENKCLLGNYRLEKRSITDLLLIIKKNLSPKATSIRIAPYSELKYLYDDQYFILIGRFEYNPIPSNVLRSSKQHIVLEYRAEMDEYLSSLSQLINTNANLLSNNKIEEWSRNTQMTLKKRIISNVILFLIIIFSLFFILAVLKMFVFTD